jgi:hypothetical protein
MWDFENPRNVSTYQMHVFAILYTSLPSILTCCSDKGQVHMHEASFHPYKRQTDFSSSKRKIIKDVEI